MSHIAEDTNSYCVDQELSMSQKEEKDKQKQGPDVKVVVDKDPDKTLDLPQDDIGTREEEAAEKRVAEELAEFRDRYLRLAAEFDNFKKITQREQQNSVRFANESLIINLLPIIDNLEQAIIAQKKSSVENNDILIGVEMVLKQLSDTLNKFGVESFSSLGCSFDPARHEALTEQEDETVVPGKVITEYQKGYLLNGRLLRPARVAVAKKPGNR